MLKKIKNWFKNDEMVKKVKTSIKDFIKTVDPKELCRAVAFFTVIAALIMRIIKIKKAEKKETVISVEKFINGVVRKHNRVHCVCDKFGGPTIFELADLGMVGKYILDAIAKNKDLGLTKNMDIYGIIVYGE